MELKDYIHYYMGATFWTPNSEGQVNAVTLQYVIDMIKKGTKVQLHLRRLEDMREDEMIGLIQSTAPADFTDKPMDDEYNLNMFYNDGGNLVNADIAVGAEVTCRCYEGQISIKKCGTVSFYDEAGIQEERVNDPLAFHYLLRQHFDIFGLIDAQLAIDAKTISNG
jgi:hypothetical protein